jgi:hypothetical protein
MNSDSKQPADVRQQASSLCVAAVQMVSTPRVEENLQTAAERIAEAVLQGAELVALPEYFRDHGHERQRQGQGARARWAADRSRTSSPPVRASTANLADRRFAAAVRPTSPDKVLNSSLVVQSARPARRALRQDSPLRLPAGCRRPTTKARPSRPAVSPSALPRRLAGSACRSATTSDFRSFIARWVSQTCWSCSGGISPKPPGGHTGRSCCAPGRSRISATCWPWRRVGATRTGARRTATAC